MEAAKAGMKRVPARAPGIVRLVFHDAGTFDRKKGDGGANGSIRLELQRPENKGLKRSVQLIEEMYAEVEGEVGSCSYADMIAMAGAAAIRQSGGPQIDVGVGRVDAIGPDPEGRLPSEEASSRELKRNFARSGLSLKELIVLSGAHTLGGKGFGDPLTFDNTYYSALLEKPWVNPKNEMSKMIGIPTDHNIATDEEALEYIQLYASSQDRFFEDFSLAFKKLTSLGQQQVVV